MLDQLRPETRGRSRGASAVEYGLLAAAIVAVVVLVAVAFGSYVHSKAHAPCVQVVGTSGRTAASPAGCTDTTR
jgi:Flp pilus assembly pilin Flp